MVKSLYAEDETLANTAVQILNRIARISWGSGGHSAGYVPLFVLGVGAENFNGKLDNTDTVSYTHLTLPTICSV